MARKPLAFEQQEGTGCIVPTSHKLNPDGYFRKRFRYGSLKMYHVYIWEKYNGSLPKGYEVHHLCGNRACCNPEHLQAIEGHEHTVLGNRERYAARLKKARAYWMTTKCTGTHLGKKFGVTFSTGCHWIQQWKMEGVETIPQGSRGAGESPASPEARSTGSHHIL